MRAKKSVLNVHQIKLKRMANPEAYKSINATVAGTFGITPNNKK